MPTGSPTAGHTRELPASWYEQAEAAGQIMTAILPPSAMPATALQDGGAMTNPARHLRSVGTAWQADDPVLAALRAARDRRDQADRDIRILLAYARELATPAPTGLPTWPRPPASPSPASGSPTPS